MVRHLLLLCVGAQTGCREEPPAAVWVCASLPGKPYSSVEGRKPCTRKSPRRLREFAPPSRESLILPLRGANPSPGKVAGGCVSLRPIPGKACYEVTVVKRRLQERFISRHGTFVFSCQHLERALI